MLLHQINAYSVHTYKLFLFLWDIPVNTILELFYLSQIPCPKPYMVPRDSIILNANDYQGLIAKSTPKTPKKPLY